MADEFVALSFSVMVSVHTLAAIISNSTVFAHDFQHKTKGQTFIHWIDIKANNKTEENGEEANDERRK